MDWNSANFERDADGMLTPLAMALDALSDYGCDCGNDEPGTCLACLCETALRSMYEERDALRDAVIIAGTTAANLHDVISTLRARVERLERFAVAARPLLRTVSLLGMWFERKAASDALAILDEKEEQNG